MRQKIKQLLGKVKAIIIHVARRTKQFAKKMSNKIKHFFVQTGRAFVRGCRKIKRFFVQMGRAFIRGCRKIKRFFVRIGRAFVRGYRKIKRFFVRLGRKIKREWKTPKKLFAFSSVKNAIKVRKEVGNEEDAIREREETYKAGFLEQLLPILDNMPSSNGSRYYGKLNAKIAIIADEFLYDSFKDIADFIYITPENYLEFVNKVDFLFVASAWRGLHNEWRLMATEGTETNKALHQTIDAYKENGKTIVFYSKEDPPNYEHFLPIAKRADVIFTTCIEKVEDYKKDCGTENVHVLKFCINPVFHNPIGMRNEHKRDGVFFAGSWMRKYPERTKSLEMMLDAVLETGKELTIADRNFSQNNINYFFPKKYFANLTKEIPHDYLQKVHKLYDWAININSITESKTMFANRVYELQANGCLMLSNRSVGVQEQFEEVIIVDEPEEIKSVLQKYDSEEIYRHQINGIRRVMTGETCYDRVKTVLTTLGYDIQDETKSVLVVAEKLTPEIKEMFDSQTYKAKDIVEISNLSEEMYNSYDMVTKWDNDSQYVEYYLEDMINGFKYTDCKYITKQCYIMDGDRIGSVEHDYVDYIENCYATIFWRSELSFNDFMQLEEKLALTDGYSSDHFNYCKLN